MTWQHPICGSCWETTKPGQKATVTKDEGEEFCCWCSRVTTSGIRVRADSREEPVKSHCQCPQELEEVSME